MGLFFGGGRGRCHCWGPTRDLRGFAMGGGRLRMVSVGSVLASRPPCGAQWGSMGLWGLAGGGQCHCGYPRVFCVGSAWGVGDSAGSACGHCWHCDPRVGCSGALWGQWSFGVGGRGRCHCRFPRVFCVGTAWGGGSVGSVWDQCWHGDPRVGRSGALWGLWGLWVRGGGGHDVPLRGTHACFAWAQPAGAAGSQWGQR